MGKELVKMKLKRSGMAVAAVALGVLVLTTSAFADVLAGSGYMGLKNAVKTPRFIREATM